MYNDYYGFTGRPFQLTPDPAFYFESLSHRKALSYLGYGLAQGEGFVVITGEVGAGKSTLVAHLMATIDRARLTAGQVAASKLDGDQLLAAVAGAFGVDDQGGDNKVTTIAAIERFLHDEARAGRRCLLVVDEAQNLAIAALEELRLLSNFQLGAHPLLQILLLGQPEFRSQLQTHPDLEQLRQRVIASHHLDSLESGEVERYVMHRLACVGWDGHPGFDPRVHAELYTATGGVPRRINQIVNRLLLLGAVEQKEQIDGVMLSHVLAELTGDGGLQLAQPVDPADAGKPVAAPSKPLAPARGPSPELAAPAAPDRRFPVGGDGVNPVADAPAATKLADALAKRDVQIAELQQAVLELAETGEGHGHDAHHRIDIAALQERLANLESRVIEQERTIRHTLTMLIEWIERDDTHRAAA
jgi:general secretion pathway protein A